MSRDFPMAFVPLVDAAPLIVADALGFAEEEGLRFVLHAATSWAALRDMLAVGQVDAAQMLAPMPVAAALGLMRGPVGFEALAVLNLNGNAIGVSNALADKMARAGHGFDFTDARSAGLALLAACDTLRIGVPFAFSMHAELVQYWLTALGADPLALNIRTIPPPRMAEALAAGEIDAFCVGEPWGSVAVATGAGSLLLPSRAIWSCAPEKVLATRAGWADENPKLAGAVLRAVWRAARWLADPENMTVAAEILSGPGRLGMAADVIERALTGRLQISPSGAERLSPDFITFHTGAANFPWRSQAAWIATALARRHGLKVDQASQLGMASFRSDLYRQHLRGTAADLPGASEKLEGAVATPFAVPAERGHLILPQDQFFDARIFDPTAAAR